MAVEEDALTGAAALDVDLALEHRRFELLAARRAAARRAALPPANGAPERGLHLARVEPQRAALATAIELDLSVLWKL